MASVDVSFLNLAYLVEIAVVLNLTFRELKFTDSLNLKDKVESKLETALDQIELRAKEEQNVINSASYNLLKKIHGVDGTAFTIQGILEYLIKSDVTKFNSFKFSACYILFFKYLVQTRSSLTITNLYILYSVLLLIMFTALSGEQVVFTVPAILELSYYNHVMIISFIIGVCSAFIIHITTIHIFSDKIYQNFLAQLISISAILISFFYYLANGSNFFIEKSSWLVNFPESYLIIWFVSFGFLVISTITPIVFIRVVSECEHKLIGERDKLTVAKIIEMSQKQDVNESKISGLLNQVIYKMYKDFFNDLNNVKLGAENFRSGKSPD